MKTTVFLGIIFLPFLVMAQIIHSPFPMKGSDFIAIDKEKITLCTVYKITEDYDGLADSIPVMAVEYGSLGLPAVLYTFGVNEDDEELLDTTAITYYKYDDKVRLWIEDTEDMEHGETKTLYTYNKKGQLVKKEVAMVDPPTYNYKYDKKGLLTEIYITQKMPVYDDNGDFNGKTFERPASRYIVENDSRGRISSMSFYLLMGNEESDELTGLKKWEYDDKGRVSNLLYYQSDGTTLEMETPLYYNDLGLLSGYDEISYGETVQFRLVYCSGCIQSWMKN
jgi:hypothetical protein